MSKNIKNEVKNFDIIFFILKSIVTFFGIGNSKTAPGTFGSLAAIPFFVLLSLVFTKLNGVNPISFFITIIFVMIIIEYIAIYFYMKIINNNVSINDKETNYKGDPQEIVIDEVVGQLIGCFMSALSLCFFAKKYNIDIMQYKILTPLLLLIIPFFLFRLFDIKKPLLVGYLDKNCKNAFGVMMDDVIAGIYAGCINYLIIFTVLYYLK